VSLTVNTLFPPFYYILIENQNLLITMLSGDIGLPYGQESLRRLALRASLLYEQGADIPRL